jgi:hypothetical protein
VRRTGLIEKLITLANAATMSLTAAITAATSLCAARRGRSVRPSPPTPRRLRALKAFDLLELNGEDLRLPPFGKRKAKLASLLACINFGIALSGPTEALADGRGRWRSRRG